MIDCVIVGGGIIGMLTARFLRQAGLDVTLVERGQSGQESTWAGGGILSPLYPWRYPAAVNRLARWGQANYPEELAKIQDESGVDPEYQRSGLLILDVETEAARRWQQQFPQPCDWLAAEGQLAVEPQLGVTSAEAVWLPEVGQVRNPRLGRALRGSLERLGVAVREDCEVRGFRVSAGRVTGVDTSQGAIAAGRVVVAGGAWSGELLRSTGIELPIEPVRGQMILFRAEPGLVQRIVLSEGRYVIPRRDGRVLMGSTQEHVGFDKATTDTAREELTAAAHRLIPALAGYPVEHHWSGLRPGSPEGVPVIGAHPGIAGLFVNSGHYRNGVVLGLASARLLADQLLERSCILDPAPYSPDKFMG